MGAGSEHARGRWGVGTRGHRAGQRGACWGSTERGPGTRAGGNRAVSRPAGDVFSLFFLSKWNYLSKSILTGSPGILPGPSGGTGFLAYTYVPFLPKEDGGNILLVWKKVGEEGGRQVGEFRRRDRKRGGRGSCHESKGPASPRPAPLQLELQTRGTERWPT